MQIDAFGALNGALAGVEDGGGGLEEEEGLFGLLIVKFGCMSTGGRHLLDVVSSLAGWEGFGPRKPKG